MNTELCVFLVLIICFSNIVAIILSTNFLTFFLIVRVSNFNFPISLKTTHK